MTRPIRCEALMSQPSMTYGSRAVPNPPVTPLFAVRSALPSMKIGPWAASVPEGKSPADGLAQTASKRTRVTGAHASILSTRRHITPPPSPARRLTPPRLIPPGVRAALHRATRDMEEVSWIEFHCQPSLRAVLQSESAEDQEAVEVPLPVVMPGRRRSSPH